MSQLKVKYHQLKIDMFALYRATMDHRGVKVYQADQALKRISGAEQDSGPAPTDHSSADATIHLPATDADYVQSLADMESRFQLGPSSYRGRARRLDRLPPPIPHSRRRALQMSESQLAQEDTEDVCGSVNLPSSSKLSWPLEKLQHGRELDAGISVPVIRCYRCTQRFDSPEHLFQHWNEMINCRIVCLFCRECFVTNSTQDKHELRCELIKCVHCQYECKTIQEYSAHITRCDLPEECEPVTTLNAPLMCPYCMKTYVTFTTFKNHINDDHETEHYTRFGVKVLRKYRTDNSVQRCNRCSQCFYDSELLRQHQEAHKKRERHACRVCGKSFRSIATLKQHMLIHGKVYQFKCSLCDKGFEKNRHLMKHLSTEHQHEIIPCHTCSNQCYGYADLINHLKNEHAMKKYTCDVCQCSFVLKRELNRHVLTHKDHASFDCEHCGQSFLTQRKLQFHQKREHEPDDPPSDVNGSHEISYDSFQSKSPSAYRSQYEFVEDSNLDAVNQYIPVDDQTGLSNASGYHHFQHQQPQVQEQERHQQLMMLQQNSFPADGHQECLSADNIVDEMSALQSYQVYTNTKQQLVARSYSEDGRSLHIPIHVGDGCFQQQQALLDLAPVTALSSSESAFSQPQVISSYMMPTELTTIDDGCKPVATWDLHQAQPQQAGVDGSLSSSLVSTVPMIAPIATHSDGAFHPPAPQLSLPTNDQNLPVTSINYTQYPVPTLMVLDCKGDGEINDNVTAAAAGLQVNNITYPTSTSCCYPAVNYRHVTQVTDTDPANLSYSMYTGDGEEERSESQQNPIVSALIASQACATNFGDLK